MSITTQMRTKMMDILGGASKYDRHYNDELMNDTGLNTKKLIYRIKKWSR